MTKKNREQKHKTLVVLDLSKQNEVAAHRMRQQYLRSWHRLRILLVVFFLSVAGIFAFLYYKKQQIRSPTYKDGVVVDVTSEEEHPVPSTLDEFRAYPVWLQIILGLIYSSFALFLLVHIYQIIAWRRFVGMGKINTQGGVVLFNPADNVYRKYIPIHQMNPAQMNNL